jgi:hypothetical protein
MDHPTFLDVPAYNLRYLPYSPLKQNAPRDHSDKRDKQNRHDAEYCVAGHRFFRIDTDGSPTERMYASSGCTFKYSKNALSLISLFIVILRSLFFGVRGGHQSPLYTYKEKKNETYFLAFNIITTACIFSM